MVATTTSVTTARASNGASAREAATVARRRMPRLGMRSGGLSPAGGRHGGGGEGLRSTSLDARTDVEASTKRASTKSTETPDFGFPGFPSFPDGFAPPSNPLESLPNYENLEKASKLAQDAFNTMVVENEDPLSGARRVAQAIEAAGAVLGDAISSGESEALLRDATDAFRQAVSEIQGAQSSSETTAGSPGRDSGAAAASSQRSDESLRRAAKLLRKYFERMGAAYVKLGQFIASSPTLFPKPIVDEFQGCLDDVPPLDYGTEISRVIQRELGGDKRVREVFSYIEETPVASASIAQVHRGTLRSTGQQVVLKVCKPGVGQSLRTDLDAVYLACRALELLDPSIEQRLGLSAIIQDAREAILAETDLLQEARNMRSFRSFLENSAPTFDQVAIPEVIETLSTKKVLVMEELKGVSLSEYLDGSAAFKRSVSAQSTDALIVEALNAWIASVAFCDSFHADVHAGNLFVLYDGRLAFIDFGSVGRISTKTKRSLDDLASALPRRDWRRAAESLVGMGAIMGSEEETQAQIGPLARDLETLTERVEALVDTMMTSDVNVTTASIGALSGAAPDAPGRPSDYGVPDALTLEIAEKANRLVLDVVDIAERRGLRFPREFALLIKQMLYFDRFVQELAPELDVLTDDRVNKQLS